MKAVIFNEHGGPEVLEYVEYPPLNLERDRYWFGCMLPP